MTPNHFLHRHSYGDDEFVRDLNALLDAERAKAREEQREACADSVLGYNCGCRGAVGRASLTATPLADRIAELERKRDEARALAKTAGEALLAAGLVVLPERCSPRCSSNAAQYDEDNRCDCGREEGEHRNKVCEDALSALRAAGVLS